MDMKEVRAKFPQYSDISDEKLLQGLHAKHYSDMPYDQFQSNITGVTSSQPTQPVAPQEQGQLAHLGQGVMDYIVKPANELAGAIVDPLATMASGVASYAGGNIAGLAATNANRLGLTNLDAQKVKDLVSDKLQYEPKTQLGTITTKPIQAIGSIIEAGAERATSGIDNIHVRRATKEALLNAPALIGAKKVPNIRAKTATEIAMNAERDAARTGGENLGFIAPPEGGVVRRTMYKIGNAADDVSLANQQKFTGVLAKDVGIPENTPITKEIVMERRAVLNQDYDRFANSLPNGVRLSQGFTNAMQKRLADVNNKLGIEKETFKELEGVPEVLNEQIARAATVRDAQGLIDSIGALRLKSTEANATGKKRAGKIYKDIADGYEKAMSQQLKTQGNGQIYADFELARKQHAKLHFLEDVVDPVSGLVDFQLLRNKSGSSLAKDQYLSGDTKIAADFARQFPMATKKLTADKRATAGAWQVTVPVAATASAATGASTGLATGSTTAALVGALSTGIPLAVGAIAPNLAKRGMLRRTPEYGSTKKQGAYGVVGASPYITEEKK